MSEVRITAKGHTAAVEVAGHDISTACRAFTLSAQACQAPVLELDVVAHKIAEFQGDAIVRFTPDFEQILTDLGWTQPSGDQE
jgi:hypothetical protein